MMVMEEGSQKVLSFGASRALRILKSGGYFRAIKSVARGYEGTYTTNLYTKSGEFVYGLGYTVLKELVDAGQAKSLCRVPTPLWGENKEAIESKMRPHTLTAQNLPKEIIYTLAYPFDS
jgi:hypothetical protein